MGFKISGLKFIYRSQEDKFVSSWRNCKKCKSPYLAESLGDRVSMGILANMALPGLELLFWKEMEVMSSLQITN